MDLNSWVNVDLDWLVGWLGLVFMVYQPFSGHLMPDQIILIKILF